jgi:hypothetical protein
MAMYGISKHNLDVYEYLRNFIKELLDSSESVQIDKSACRTMLLRLGLDIETASWIEHRMYLELIERLEEVFERLEDTKIANRLEGYNFDVVGRNYDLVFLIMES